MPECHHSDHSITAVQKLSILGSQVGLSSTLCFKDAESHDATKLLRREAILLQRVVPPYQIRRLAGGAALSSATVAADATCAEIKALG